MAATKDFEIRKALHDKKFVSYRSAPNTLVVDELGLSHAKVRIDIAVINGCVHGFEIKSSLDTLERLPLQLELYGKCLEKLTLVCAPRHVKQAKKLAPKWCSIIEASKGSRGAITFSTVRRGYKNPHIDKIQLAHLLWRPEAAALLARHGVEGKELRKPRKQLYEGIADLMTVPQLTAAIREFMQQRLAWRGPPVRA